MLERTFSFLGLCRSIGRGIWRRRKELTTKILKSPFFPILFIGEAVKTAVIAKVTVGVFLTPVVQALAITAAIVTFLWMVVVVVIREVVEEIDESTENNES